jgi:hypothetical protein
MADYGYMLEGYGPDQGHYDKMEEKKDKHLMAAIWIGLFIFSTAMLVLTVYGHIKEVKLYYTGNYIDVTYREGMRSATLIDASGKAHNCKFYSDFSKHTEDKIRLYYYGDKMENAMPMSSASYYILMYSGFGILWGISFYLMYKNLRTTHHSKNAVPKYDTYR